MSKKKIIIKAFLTAVLFLFPIIAFSCTEGNIQYRVSESNPCETERRTCCGYPSDYNSGDVYIDFAPASSYYPEWGEDCCGPEECFNVSSKKCEPMVCPTNMKAPKNGYISKSGMCSDYWDYVSCEYGCNYGYCLNEADKTCEPKPQKYCSVQNGSCSYECSCGRDGWHCEEKITCNTGYTPKESWYGKRCVRDNASWSCISQEGDCNEYGGGWGSDECPLTPHDGGSCNPYDYNDASSYTCATTSVTGYSSGYSCYDCRCQ